MPRVTTNIVFWHSLRCLLLGKFSVDVRRFILQHCNKGQKNWKKLIVVLAVVFGSILYNVICDIFDKIVCKVFGMIKLTAIDEIFIYDTPDARAQPAILIKQNRWKDFNETREKEFNRMM